MRSACRGVPRAGIGWARALPRTLEPDLIFELSDGCAIGARTRSACARAVDRLPNRRRQVIQGYYFEVMTRPELVARHGVADSTIRDIHAGALRNLRRAAYLSIPTLDDRAWRQTELRVPSVHEHVSTHCGSWHRTGSR